jgi:hypothetical protein
VGLSAIFGGDDEKKKAEKLLAAKETSDQATQTETPLAADSEKLKGLTTEKIRGFQEGGVADDAYSKAIGAIRWGIRGAASEEPYGMGPASLLEYMLYGGAKGQPLKPGEEPTFAPAVEGIGRGTVPEVPRVRPAVEAPYYFLDQKRLEPPETTSGLTSALKDLWRDESGELRLGTRRVTRYGEDELANWAEDFKRRQDLMVKPLRGGRTDPLEMPLETKVADKFKMEFPPLELAPESRTTLGGVKTYGEHDPSTTLEAGPAIRAPSIAAPSRAPGISAGGQTFINNFYTENKEMFPHGLANVPAGLTVTGATATQPIRDAVLMERARLAGETIPEISVRPWSEDRKIYKYLQPGEYYASPIVSVDDIMGSRKVFITGEQLVSELGDFRAGPPTSRAEVSAYEALRPELFGTKFTGKLDPGSLATGSLSTAELYGRPLRAMVGGTTTTGQWYVDYGRGWEPTGVTPRSATPGTWDLDKYRLDAAATAKFPSTSDIAHLAGGEVLRPQDLLHNQAARQAYAEWENNPANRLRAMTTGANPIFDEGTSAKILENQQQILAMPQPFEAATFAPPVVSTFSDYEFSGMAAGNIGVPEGFQHGGLAQDETLAILQAGERVLPKFHGGGIVGYQGGGVADEGMAGGGAAYTPVKSSPASESSTRAVYSSISTLSSSMVTLSSDVSKVAGGFKSLERSMAPASSATSSFSSTLSAASGAVSGFQSILNLFSSSGGGGGGGGGLGGIGSAIGGFSKIFGLFGLEHGGIIPSAQGGMIMGGVGRGGTLAVLHPNEMVLPSHISQSVQDMADGGGGGPTPDIHFHLHTIDQKSGAQFLMGHKDVIAGLYKNAYRNFNPNVPSA